MTVGRTKRGESGPKKSRNRRILPSVRKHERRRIAVSIIEHLISLAIDESKSNPKLASRYAQLAWSVSTRFNVRLNKKRRLFCRFCKAFLAIPGNVRYRFSKKRKGLNITCLRCGKTYREILPSEKYQRT